MRRLGQPGLPAVGSRSRTEARYLTTAGYPAAVATDRPAPEVRRVLSVLRRHVDLLQTELLALVQVGRAWQGEHGQQDGPPYLFTCRTTSSSPAPTSPTRRRARPPPGCGPPRRGSPAPTARQEPVEVEGPLQLVGPDVRRGRLGRVGQCLRDGHPIPVVLRPPSEELAEIEALKAENRRLRGVDDDLWRRICAGRARRRCSLKRSGRLPWRPVGSGRRSGPPSVSR